MATGNDDTASDYDLEFDSAHDALLCELADAVSAPHQLQFLPTATNPVTSRQEEEEEEEEEGEGKKAPERRRDGLEMDIHGVARLCSPSSSLAGPLALAASVDDSPATQTGDTLHVRELEKQLEEKALAALPQADTLDVDSVPPLTRFRTFPRKSLTVTDLTSGAWCELQHFYTLSRLPGGRKTRTNAMAQGTRVHKVLEDQVHETVAVEVLSREDAVGVRVWNLIQSLRTLAETGLTREMQVWGVTGGQVVSGIIDGVGWENPDAGGAGDGAGEGAGQDAGPDAGQDAGQDAREKERPRRLVYLTDVKTRGSATVPVPAAIWPAMVQLYLYHRFLEDMVTDKLNFLKVFRRYGADPDEPFSDTFLAQMAAMHGEMLDPASSPSPSPTITPTPTPTPTPPTTADETAESSSDGSCGAALRFRTLRELVALIKPCLAAAFPEGTASIADRLCVEYRHRSDGGLIARKTFDYDAKKLDDFVTADLEWWRGERPPRGVTLEDTFKCRTCEFADDCQWRHDLALKKLREVREKLLKKRKESDAKMDSLGW